MEMHHLGNIVFLSILLAWTFTNPCPTEVDFVKPKNIPTFEPTVQTLHCGHSFWSSCRVELEVLTISQILKVEHFQIFIFTLIFFLKYQEKS